MKIHIVTAYRWGDHENHSYIVGAYSNKVKAIRAASTEEDYRGGKYTCEVVEVIIDREGWIRRSKGIPKLKRSKAFWRFVGKYLPT